MGDHAIDAIDRGYAELEYLDNYLGCRMSDGEAYDLGIIDEAGALCLAGAEYTQSLEIPTLEFCQRELISAEKDLHIFSLQMESGSPNRPTISQKELELKKSFPNLNKLAIKNLSKPSPTCNVCGEMMAQRSGRYGIFYFCPSTCDGQRTVSMAYWESLRAKYLSIVEA